MRTWSIDKTDKIVKTNGKKKEQTKPDQKRYLKKNKVATIVSKTIILGALEAIPCTSD